MWVFILGIGVALAAATIGAAARMATRKYNHYPTEELREVFVKNRRIGIVFLALAFVVPFITGLVLSLFGSRLNMFMTVLMAAFVIASSITGVAAAIRCISARKELRSSDA
jgi:Kef-type K+ transport system membrane component KefB